MVDIDLLNAESKEELKLKRHPFQAQFCKLEDVNVQAD